MRRSETIAEQAAHPHGFLGWIIGSIMSKETKSDNDKAFDLLGVQATDRIIDIGTGHGQSLTHFSKMTSEGRVVGVDSSDVMLTIARRKNRAGLKSGRVELHKASGDDLDFSTASFDKALAIHTLYFWNPALPYLQEILRVLTPGGCFVLGFRPAEDEIVVSKFPTTVYEFRTIAEVEALAREAGFSDVTVLHDYVPGKSMVWLSARKPFSVAG